jgi:hypothetical protein
MSFFNLIILIIGLFVISRVVLRWKDKQLTMKSGIFWVVLWTLIFGISIYPKLSQKIASWIGIGRGVDSAFFIAVILLFYLIFRLYIKIDKIDKDLTSLVVELSKKDSQKNNPNSK